MTSATANQARGPLAEQGWQTAIEQAAPQLIADWTVRFARDEEMFRDAVEWMRRALSLGGDLAPTHGDLAWAVLQLRVLSEAFGRRELIEAAPFHDLAQQLDDAILSALPQFADSNVHYFHELLLTALNPNNRRRFGAYYTPLEMAEYLLDRAGRDLPVETDELLVVDPSCGSGLFLQLAGERFPSARVRGFELQYATAVAAAFINRNAAIEHRNALEFSRPLESERAGAELLIVGNPPYANFGDQNRGLWIDSQMDAYKRGLGERKHNLHDDYIRFIRWSQYHVDQALAGVVALVVNNSFIDGLTHRVMRQSLLQTFDEIEVVNLHGHVTRRRSGPVDDENVFGIKQGVALIVMRKRASETRENNAAQVHYAQLQGKRDAKLAALSRTAGEYKQVTPTAPDFRFTNAVRPPSRNGAEPPRLNELAPCYGSGVQTKRDSLFVDIDAAVLTQRMRDWFAGGAPLDTPAWLARRREQTEFSPERVIRYMTAPLDVRYVYYDPQLIGRGRWSVMRHMLASDSETPPRGLVFMRQSKNAGEYDHFFAVDCLISDRVFYSPHGAPFLAPWQFDSTFEPKNAQTGPLDVRGFDVFAEFPTQLRWHYYYAVFHADRYRRRYADDLPVNFPPTPAPRDAGLLRDYARLGEQLSEAHVAGAENAEPMSPVTRARAESIASRPRYDRQSKAIFVHADARVPAPPGALDWSVGGYRVIHRWLVQRAGRAFDEQLRADLERRIDAFAAHVRIVAQINKLPANWS